MIELHQTQSLICLLQKLFCICLFFVRRELAFFFPEFVVPTAEGKPKVQRTLALVRPDAFKLHKGL